MKDLKQSKTWKGMSKIKKRRRRRRKESSDVKFKPKRKARGELLPGDRAKGVAGATT